MAKSSNQQDKSLMIRWQRLVNETGQTCQRCQFTGITVENVYNKLKKALSELGIEVTLEKEVIGSSAFSKAPLESNRIWVGEKTLEEWLSAAVGQSRCCDVCGDSGCRTLKFASTTFEIIPKEFIIRAGLLAAAELFP